MIDWPTNPAAGAALAAFLGSFVEFVEALTIVLAVGLTRGWSSALAGAGAATASLVALIALIGPALSRAPLPLVQTVVGALLLLFGLRWLRKAILRAAGVIAIHDEAAAYARETLSLGRIGRRGGAFDGLAFATSFKIVMLEGVEVVFIVIAVGAGGPLLAPAVIGAGAALALVVALGLALRSPLARVPENALKFVVGVLLTAFGVFWLGEGMGVAWPGADASLLGLIAAFLVVAAGAIPLARRISAGA